MAKKNLKGQLPELSEIEQVMTQERSRGKYHQALKGTAGTVVVVAALAVLIATLVLPVLRVTGNTMQPGFQPGDILLIYQKHDIKNGEVCCFYYNNKMIIKRVIAQEGDIVEIDEEGHVSVNGTVLEEEEYISEYALGLSDLEYPFQVPANTYFVLGDNRDNSVDSRAEKFGCIPKEEIVGKVLTRIYPLNGLAWYGF